MKNVLNISSQNHRSSERGNVLIIIFIGVALFAALGFTVADIMRTGNPESIGEQQSYLFADEIFDYGRSIRQTIQALKIDGCSNTEISFEGLDDQWAGQYVNPNAPLSKKCHVFDSAGGGAAKLKVIDDWLYQPWGFVYSGIEFNSEISVEGIGTSDSELILWIYNLKPKICFAINERLGLTEDHVDTTTALTDEFKGTYSLAADNLGDDGPGVFENQMMGCQYNSSGYGHFFQVMIVR